MGKGRVAWIKKIDSWIMINYDKLIWKNPDGMIKKKQHKICNMMVQVIQNSQKKKLQYVVFLEQYIYI
jgi:hypothetical protein